MSFQILQRVAWALTALVPSLSFAAPARLDDYAQGVTVDVLSPRAIVELSIPDAVYQHVVTDDSSDLAVFNANGTPVPHALCAAPTSQLPTILQEALPVYRLQDIKPATSDGTRVEVQTPGGAQISVEGESLDAREARTSAYVIDARGTNGELRALQFDWSSPDGASEVRVSIQASEDLDQWRTIVAGSMLVSLQAGEQQLRRHRVAIPQAQYRYLRVERVDRGPPLQVDGVIAERVMPAPLVEPMWFFATPADSTPSALTFDAARRAPITYARLALSQNNTSLRVAIESRNDEKAAWRTQWSGEAYVIQTESERKVSPPAEFRQVADRFWRVRLTNEAETFAQIPSLELGYRPARLRFLAQGEAPYTLAFGSRRASVSPRRCEALLAGLNQNDLDQNIGEALTGLPRELGGEDALRPLPKKTPLRQIVLWSVLILGVAALVGMALSLLRRVSPDGRK
jgi:hypothetical protein